MSSNQTDLPKYQFPTAQLSTRTVHLVQQVNLVSPTKCLPGSPLKMSMCSHCLRLLLLSLTSNLWGILPTVPAKTILIQTSRQPHLCKARGQFHVSSSTQGTADGSCFLKLCLVFTPFSPGSSLPWLKLFLGLLYQFLLISEINVLTSLSYNEFLS